MSVTVISRLEAVPLDGPFGAEIRGVDLSRPLDPESFEAIRLAFHSNGFLLFRHQSLSPSQLVGFSRRFGESDNEAFWAPPYFHTIGTHRQRPCLGAMLHMAETPAAGAETWFADMAAAYDALPATIRQRIEGLRAVHDPRRLNGRIMPDWPPVAHPVVRTHPVTRRRSLFLGGEIVSHTLKAGRIDTREVVADLLEWGTQARFVVRHSWRRGDLVFWDNRCTMHRSFGLRSVNWATVAGGVPF